MIGRTDIVIVNPGDRRATYQALGDEYCAVEPPYWAAVMAAWLRARGHNVVIVDSNAENISPDDTALRVKECDPLICAVVVYGSQPSASTWG